MALCVWRSPFAVWRARRWRKVGPNADIDLFPVRAASEEQSGHAKRSTPLSMAPSRHRAMDSIWSVDCRAVVPYRRRLEELFRAYRAGTDEVKNSGVRSQESGVRSQESGVRSQESGVRSQESGVRSQESGVRSQER
jgi:hypothetical protein